MDSLNSMPRRRDIDLAAKRFFLHYPETPVLQSERLNKALGAEVFFKAESMMPQMGAFKIRGALNAILSLATDLKLEGVLAQSSGNHGQAVALVAREVGIKARIVVPEDAPDIKKQGMELFGAEIVESGPRPDQRKAMTEQVQAESGYPLIHPFENPYVIAGQATVVREMISQIPGLQDVIVQIGGGGLISGSVLSQFYYAPQLKIHGAEAEHADDYSRMVRGLPARDLKGPVSVADGLRVPIGDPNARLINGSLESLSQVSEAEIIEAMFLVWQHLRVIVEPSAAVGFAVLRKNIQQFVGKKVGVILTGGNVDMARAFGLFEKHGHV